jgi:formate hydrogenlyase transcriptional activator
VECVDRVPTIEKDGTERRFQQIIGESPCLEYALAEVERVSPTDSTVLVLGETGTGKELISRAIHNLSPRCGRPFIKLNCAAIPFDLLESELFGHEKGAFTGAIAQKIGRFEMAHTGTLFLDEIGDLPLALQPKLLRVLQDQEFERLGSGRTHRVNVRLVAATHRDLGDMVKRNEFRSDLYYRLNVFPIVIPPLRDRREDIAPLVVHFVDLFGRRMGKRITHIPEETMAAFAYYSWPGNVRELQNLVERAVIRSNDGVLSNPLPGSLNVTSIATSARHSSRDSERRTAEISAPRFGAVSTAQATLKESERSLILRTLEATGWVNGGADGAAARLGLKRTTLIAKMKKLGISRPLNELVENWESEQS